MTQKTTETFDITGIRKDLPVLFNKLSEEKISVERDPEGRIANFEIYNAGISTCYNFHRPISRVLKIKQS